MPSHQIYEQSQHDDTVAVQGKRCPVVVQLLLPLLTIVTIILAIVATSNESWLLQYLSYSMTPQDNWESPIDQGYSVAQTIQYGLSQICVKSSVDVPSIGPQSNTVCRKVGDELNCPADMPGVSMDLNHFVTKVRTAKSFAIIACISSVVLLLAELLIIAKPNIIPRPKQLVTVFSVAVLLFCGGALGCFDSASGSVCGVNLCKLSELIVKYDIANTMNENGFTLDGGISTSCTSFGSSQVVLCFAMASAGLCWIISMKILPKYIAPVASATLDPVAQTALIEGGADRFTTNQIPQQRVIETPPNLKMAKSPARGGRGGERVIGNDGYDGAVQGIVIQSPGQVQHGGNYGGTNSKV